MALVMMQDMVQASPGKSVLLADKDRQLLHALALQCRKLGFEVRTVSKGLDVVIEALAAPPDLFILDINMPAGDGLRVCQKLVHYPGFRSIPIIFLTGRFDQEALEVSAALGARHLLKDHRSWETIKGIIDELFPPEPAPLASGNSVQARRP
jgi:CheY-like chemotaxis protein